jgi:hypothetical protein
MSTEQLEFKLGEDEQPATVQVDEEGKAEVLDKPEPPEVVTSSGEQDNPDNKNELDQYSENVRKRIDKLTARLRETQRREQAALEYAKNAYARAQQLEQQFLSTDQQRVAEATGRIDTQLVALKQIIRKAREEGDIDTETEAQQRLTSLTMEQAQIQAQEAQRKAYAESVAAKQSPQSEPANQGYAAPQQFGQPQAQQFGQPQQPPPRQIDPKVEEWAEKNPWYGRDTVMTHAAWGIHRQLIEAEGFDASTDEYYHELDRRIREAFPRKFSGAQNGAARNVQTVAPASRSSGINASARRVVKLTPSQVAIAKKLGVPLEEYAKFVKD